MAVFGCGAQSCLLKWLPVPGEKFALTKWFSAFVSVVPVDVLVREYLWLSNDSFTRQGVRNQRSVYHLDKKEDLGSVWLY